MIVIVSSERPLWSELGLHVHINRRPLDNESKLFSLVHRTVNISNGFLHLEHRLFYSGLWIPVGLCLTRRILFAWTEFKELICARKLWGRSTYTLFDIAWSIKFLLEWLLTTRRLTIHEDAISVLPLINAISDVLQTAGTSEILCRPILRTRDHFRRRISENFHLRLPQAI